MRPLQGDPESAEISVYADMTVVKVRGHVQRGGGRRGAVTRFTNSARKRMLSRLGQIRENFRDACFMTLTYPREWNTDPRRWKRDLDVIIKRIRRKWPDACGIWRIEFQERGAPHFHLIIWNMTGRTGDSRFWISRSWFEVVGSGDFKHYRAGTNFTRLRNRKRAGRYVSKYSAKVAGNPVDPETGELVQVGRWWGTFGAISVGRAIRAVVLLSEYHQIRRLAARLLKSRHVAYSARLARLDGRKGCTIYGLGDQTCEQWSSVLDSTIFRMIQSGLRSA